jgi:hypothetical protein
MNIAGDHKLTLEEITLMIKEDPLIKDRIIEVLKMNPYDRRLVLNNWLEQLHIRRAPENLQHALSTLFDNKMAEKVLTMINNTNI